MAHIHLRLFAHTLNKNTDVNIILPTPNSDELMEKEENRYFRDDMQYQVLYLLHGTYGDYSDWCRNTCIERYAQMHKIAIVMPSAENSFYQDMVHGPKYLTYLTEELPLYLCRLFPISTKREDTFIAGLSMGGYGAWHIALTKPDQYAAAASLSGVLDFSLFVDEWLSQSESGESFERVVPWPIKAIFGEQELEKIKLSDANLMVQIKKIIQNNNVLPKLYYTIGKGDFLYTNCESANKLLEELGISVEFEEYYGQHDWTFWDAQIQRVLEWLPLKRTTV